MPKDKDYNNIHLSYPAALDPLVNKLMKSMDISKTKVLRGLMIVGAYLVMTGHSDCEECRGARWEDDWE